MKGTTKRRFKRALVILSAVLFPITAHCAESNPIVDFFKKLGDAIAHPPTPTPSPKKKSGTGRKPRNRESTTSSGVVAQTPTPAPEVKLTPTPVPVVRPTPQPRFTSKPTPTPVRRVPMPVPVVVRSAISVPPSKKPLPDLPYGIPLPNKPGFVTSPYAPKSGYVDVRGFASGTEVKDPYTGKNFLVP